MPAIYSLWIVGRNGGLLYSRVRRWLPARRRKSMPGCSATSLLTSSSPVLQDFLQLPAIDFNDKLRLASSW